LGVNPLAGLVPFVPAVKAKQSKEEGVAA
jgi:hypothetical protein